MVKSFLIITICQMFLLAAQQTILVVGEGYNSSVAILYCFEDNKKIIGPIEVNLGYSGLGFGLGKKELSRAKEAPTKREGDKKAPIGVFTLDAIFGYEKDTEFKMPYLHATKNLICVDDSDSKFYNQIIKKQDVLPNSFEEMRREDAQYELGIVVGHNKEQQKGAGSCIFIHVEKYEGAPTAGCTSMSLENIRKIAAWLDRNKNPILIQVTKLQLGEISKLYPKLEIEE
ncbi:MAG: hypothetical protein QG565_1313 [Campylobacterota bacterium]|nr:hypothetical protein [Campylobacterota bacterium]MDQ1338003.1 hypothetical protein [Campylobacterota bacterium]